MSDLPSGTVTFLFTDIAGSTRLWQEHPQTMPSVLERHDTLLRIAIEQNHGFVVKTIGDAFMAVFTTAHEGVNAALSAQLSLCAEPWPQETPIQVRMGLHMGAAEERDNDYFGHEVNRAARIQGVVHPQQIVLSQAVSSLILERLPETVTLLDLGLHQLKDLREPESLWQLCHPDLPASFPPLNSLSHWPNNLPRQLSSFVGRDTEMARVKELLARCSCLSLIGSGGCGKTRLATQAAAEMLPAFPHGVWLVELAALTEPSLVPQAIALALGLREEPGKTITQTLVEYARSRTLLLVLDNCEHLLDACVRCVDTLLRACPQIKVLATSREALNLGGEQTYRVPSMTLPDPKQPQTPLTLQQYEASRLFVERARAVKADFTVTDANALALAQMCQRLDGIPLAIELAAARVRAMPIEQIEQRLDQRFRLLTGGSRTALPRQQTLRSLIDWSYDLLTDAEKALLCRLSVFAGGWTLADAEQVCAGEPVEEWEVLDLLTSLVDKSLVTYFEQDGSARYRLLETVRQYARDRLLESGEGEQWRGRHLAHFTAFAVEAEGHVFGGERIWLERLETEHDNLRAALEWSTDSESEIGLRLVGALSRFWDIRGHFGEGRQRIIAALEADKPARRTAARARALNGAGVLAYSQGDYTAAHAVLVESLTIWRELADPPAIARSLNNLGLVILAQGDYSAARVVLEESLGIRRELGDQRGIAMSLDNLGLVVRDQGDPDSARSLHAEALAIRRQLGEQRGLATSLGNLGHLAREQGDYTAARVFIEESLSIRREIGDRQAIAWSVCSLGTLSCAQGDFAAARELLAESLMIQRELGDPQGMADAIDGLAEVDTVTGNALRAASLWGAAERLREEIGAPLSSWTLARSKEQVAAARIAVRDDVAFSAAWQEGRGLTLNQAIELALGASDD